MQILLSDRQIISAHGQDGIDFFQKIITADIKNLSEHEIAYTCQLNNRGRFLFDFFILKISNDHLLIDIHHKFVDDFMKFMDFYLLRQDIKFATDTKYFVYFDDEKQNDDGIWACDKRSENMGYRVYKDKKINGANNNLNDYHLKRLKCKIPDGFYDMETEKSIILEYGMQNHIGWEKGCYIGQELMAKTRYRGNVSKGLFLCKVKNGNIIEKGMLITDISGVKIGKVCSVYADNYLLSLLKKDQKDQKVKIDNKIDLEILC